MTGVCRGGGRLNEVERERLQILVELVLLVGLVELVGFVERSGIGGQEERRKGKEEERGGW